MNRKRHQTESLSEYHINMKAEAATIKQHLAGRFIHVSTHNLPAKGEGNTYKRK